MIRRLLADADLKLAVVTGVTSRSAEIDFKRAEDVPLKGLEDPAVLAVAAHEERVLVTHDISTMPAHLRDFVSERSSPGVIVVPQNLAIGSHRTRAPDLRGMRAGGPAGSSVPDSEPGHVWVEMTAECRALRLCNAYCIGGAGAFVWF